MSYHGLPPSVVVHVHGSSWPDAGTGGGGLSPGQMPGHQGGGPPQSPPSRLPGTFPHAAHAAALGMAGHVSARAMADPYHCQKSMPDLWSRFIRQNFADLRSVMTAFNVSERAARKWWNAEGGVNGAYVVHAMRILPEAAQSMLIAAE